MKGMYNLYTVSYNELNLNCSSINIPKYLIDLILPKCNLVFGKNFSSIYLQLIIHINNDINSPQWKKDKTWIGVNKISNIIGCNERTTSKMIKHMQDIGLVKKSYYGKLYMFSFKNHKIINMENIKEFNTHIENKLLSYAKSEKIEKLKDKFIEINKIFNPFQGYYYQFKNVNVLRQCLHFSEKIQQGSSLMFIMFFAHYTLNTNIEEIELQNLSEKERAIRLGCSQSTISRYLKSFKEGGYIDMISEFSKSPNKILINKNLQENQDNVLKQEEFKCPICNKKVESLKKLRGHISRCKDDAHKYFRELLKNDEPITIEQLNEIFKINKDEIKKIKNKKDDSKQQVNKLCRDLVRYFYGLTNTKCPSWPKEINIIKSHIKVDMHPDEVMEVMRYMSKRGYQDLTFFNNSINDALILCKCKNEINKEGSEAYLIKMYYKGMNQKMTDRIVLLAYKKIKELQNNGYDYVQIKTIVEYMIKTKCPNFNFIVTMSNEALENSKDKNEMAKAYTTEELVNVALSGIFEYGIIMLKDLNYDTLEKNIILKLKNDLCDGKVELTRVNNKYKNFAITLAKTIYNKKLYNDSFSSEQWYKLVQLDVVN